MKFSKAKGLWFFGLLVLAGFWYFASKFTWIDRTLLATPKETFSILLSGVKGENNIFQHAQQTILVTAAGWGWTLIIGVFLGLLLGFIKPIFKSFEIIFEFFRAIPPILVFPLMLVSFNYGTQAYIWTVVFGGLPIMILTVAKGVEHISKDSIEVLKINGVKSGKISLIKSIEMIPSILLGARLTFSFSLIITVVSEMVMTPPSGLALGALARDAEITFDTPTFYATVLILGLLGFVVNLILEKVEIFFGRNQ